MKLKGWHKAIRNLNDLEITFPLRYPELSIIFFKSDIVTKVSRFSSIPDERNHISAIVMSSSKERKGIK